MYSIGVLCDEIERQKELKSQMEQMLTQFVLPELKSEQPFMRLRACQTYGVYGDYKFKDLGHIQAFCEGVFNNMSDTQPLPVRFYAACALEKILTNEQAVKYIRPGIDTVLKCYLQLMNEFDNEELVNSFESIMSIFQDEIRPFALDICNHLVTMYKRCIKAD